MVGKCLCLHFICSNDCRLQIFDFRSVLANTLSNLKRTNHQEIIKQIICPHRNFPQQLSNKCGGPKERRAGVGVNVKIRKNKKTNVHWTFVFLF